MSKVILNLGITLPQTPKGALNSAIQSPFRGLGRFYINGLFLFPLHYIVSLSHMKIGGTPIDFFPY